MYTEQDKREFLRAFTRILKDMKGRGPNNIFIKYLTGEFHVVIQGVVTDYERYLVEGFGDEAFDTFTYYYKKDIKNIEKKFLELLDNKYGFELYELEMDWVSDVFVYKFKING
ncbi:MAG: hypothetical protein SCL54_06690 [Bacillota bacterium]|nr:hypothetical protein [Bacillota bacterium]